MKLISQKLTVLFLLLTIVSCVDFSNNIKKEKLSDSDFKSIATNSEYVVKLPEYMKEAKDLNDEATLQYQNIYKEVYFVVLDEPKEEFKEVFLDIGEYDESISLIKNYKQTQIGYFKESMTDFEMVSEETMQINGKNAETVSFNGKVSGVIYAISYKFTFIEGNEKVFLLMSWTLKDRREKYNDTFNYIANSFTILE